jgi:hypothetical protein
MAKIGNGSARITNTILGGLLVALVVAVGGFAFSRAQTVSDGLHGHEQIDGHPAIVERVDGMKEDVAEIKVDVKELLRRSP